MRPALLFKVLSTQGVTSWIPWGTEGWPTPGLRYSSCVREGVSQVCSPHCGSLTESAPKLSFQRWPDKEMDTALADKGDANSPQIPFTHPVSCHCNSVGDFGTKTKVVPCIYQCKKKEMAYNWGTESGLQNVLSLIKTNFPTSLLDSHGSWDYL